MDVESRSTSAYWFDVYLQGERIGEISVSQIVGGVAEFGIGLQEAYCDKGYGTDALRVFISHYFGEMEGERLDLQVHVTNKRAQRCYEKLGFQTVEETAWRIHMSLFKPIFCAD